MDTDCVADIIKGCQGDEVSNVQVLEYSPAVSKGENYCSDVYRAQIDLTLISGGHKLIWVIVKCLPNDADKLPKHKRVFALEIFVYRNVLQKMESFMTGEDKLWCDMVGCRSDTIILEDLKEIGFRSADRRQMLDWEHGRLVVEELARYHALTKILLKKGSVTKSDFGTYCYYRDQSAAERIFVQPIRAFSKVIKLEDNLANVLSKEADNIVDKMIQKGQYDESRFNVINHGDCWTNNILFHYDENTPSKIKFVDFQTSHVDSFAWDLTYLTYESIRPCVRLSKFTEILQIYHSKVRETLVKYGCHDDVPSIGHIVTEMERVKYFGSLLLCTILAMDCGDPSSSEGDKFDQYLKLYTNPTFKNLVKDDLLRFAQNGLL